MHIMRFGLILALVKPSKLRVEIGFDLIKNQTLFVIK